jgi:hypothetical protein
LDELSVATQLTVVVPSGNVLPEAGEQFTWGLESTASVAVGAGQVTTAPPGELAATDMSLGTPLSVGGVVSRTRTLKLADPVFP